MLVWTIAGVNAQDMSQPSATIANVQNLNQGTLYRVNGNNYLPMNTGIYNTPWQNYPNQQFAYYDGSAWRIIVVGLNIVTNIVNLIDMMTGNVFNPFGFGGMGNNIPPVWTNGGFPPVPVNPDTY